MDVSNEKQKLLEAANRYRAAGLCPLPALRRQKRPSLSSWKEFQTRLPEPVELSQFFSNGSDAVCIVTGAISGNLEMIDFDNGGELFEPWSCRIPPSLLERVVVESSQSGGKHVVYRCDDSVSGNAKLAQRLADGQVSTLIETRGDGGLFLCAPTSGYELVQGELDALPVLSSEERELLLLAAWDLNEYSDAHEPPCHGRPIQVSPSLIGSRPGDDYNQRGEVVALLLKHGWRPCGERADGNQHWTRPGKLDGTSATLKERTFYVFSSNASPFEP